MKLTSEEAFQLVKREGIATKYTTFMKMVREGRVVGVMSSKKKGYRFEHQEINDFIKRYKEDDTFNAKATIESLEEENELLQKQLAMPKDYWMVENQRLKELLDSTEKKLKQVINERDELKNKQNVASDEPLPKQPVSTMQSKGISIQVNNKNFTF